VASAARLPGQLLAAETELSASEEIYTRNNVRVKSVQARIEELRRQLNKISSDNGDSGSGEQSSPYPSLRKLPLLGATYADLYRRVKVQETVFEFLTKQYERAKVEEVKELPSVRILDAADLPERKSWPPRLLITCLGALLALIAGIFWLRASEVWDSLDSQDPRRLLADEFHAQWKARTSARAFALSSVRQHVQDVLFRSRRSPEKQAGD
jgi:capsule polysaccharide export protein KpsE/RkpR